MDPLYPISLSNDGNLRHSYLLVCNVGAIEPDEASYTYVVSRPDSRYSTQLVVVRLQPNWDFHLCYENACFERTVTHVPYGFFQSDILPSLQIPSELDAVQVKIGTAEEGVMFIGPIMEFPYEFLPLPNALCPALPRISIDSLRYDPLQHEVVDPAVAYMSDKFRVVRSDDEPDKVYAIKDGGFDTVSQGAEEQTWIRLIQEVELLHSIDSPFIEKPSYIVYGRKSAFRGYLKPLCRKGTVGRALREGRFTSFQVGLEMKLKWLDQIATALVKLHGETAYGVHLEVDHILITDTDDICLISVAPAPSGDTYIVEKMPPEYLHLREHYMTPDSDVWLLGIILWQFWEGLPAEYPFTRIESRTWTEDGVNAVPAWYRQLTDECLSDEPRDRPSAFDVLQRLQEGTPGLVASRSDSPALVSMPE